jgi:hypothetical protein
MSAKKTESEGFTAAELAAMKQRAAELRAEGKKGRMPRPPAICEARRGLPEDVLF